MSVPRKVLAVVTSLKKYRDNITMYRFKPEFRIKFKPGQFLHLALDDYDPSYNWPESRVFSMANAPGKDFIDILVSLKR
jgi:NAD(P)H-flavin reductase